MHGVNPSFDRPVPPRAPGASKQRRRLLRSAGVLAMAALLLAGCGGGGDDESATSTTVADTTDPPTTTEPTTTTTEPRTPEEEVEEAYWEAERVLYALYQDPHSDTSRLAETRVDPSLTTILDVVRSMQEDGIETRFPAGEPPPQEIMSINVDGEQAVLTTCFIDDSMVVDAATGDVLDESVQSAELAISMRLVDGTWKVERLASMAEWGDGLGCER